MSSPTVFFPMKLKLEMVLCNALVQFVSTYGAAGVCDLHMEPRHATPMRLVSSELRTVSSQWDHLLISSCGQWRPQKILLAGAGTGRMEDLPLCTAPPIELAAPI